MSGNCLWMKTVPNEKPTCISSIESLKQFTDTAHYQW